MDNHAQVAMEYLVITALLIVVGALVTLIASSLYTTKEGLSGTNSLYTRQAEAMLG